MHSHKLLGKQEPFQEPKSRNHMTYFRLVCTGTRDLRVQLKPKNVNKENKRLSALWRP